MVIFGRILLGMRTFSNKTVEKIKTYILHSAFLYIKIVPFETMCKNMELIFAFPCQKWSGERATMLLHTHIAHRVGNSFMNSGNKANLNIAVLN
jgi:hypothetical protein